MQCLSGTTLVLDASSTRLFAGVIDCLNPPWLGTAACELHALEGLFTCVEAALEQAGTELGAVRNFVYCEGPGSVLGLRLCAMAIETWRRLAGHRCALAKYSSLDLAACQALANEPDCSDGWVVSDWKKGHWNALRIRGGQCGPITTVASTTLAGYSGSLFHLPQRKGWQAPPESARTLDYQPESLPTHAAVMRSLKTVSEVELYAAAAPAFKKWTPTRHTNTQTT